MNEQIENLAKELKDRFNVKRGWRLLAKFIIIRDLEVRIYEHEQCCAYPGCKVVPELRKQLNQLRGEK